MMYHKLGLNVVFISLALGGCSPAADSPDEDRQSAATEVAAATSGEAGGHIEATPGVGERSEAVNGSRDMATMDHSSMVVSGASDAPTSEDGHAVEHGGGSSASAQTTQALDHARMNMPQASAGATRAGGAGPVSDHQGADHSAGAAPGASDGVADPARSPAVPRDTGPEHAQHSVAPQQAQPPAGGGHAQQAPGAVNALGNGAPHSLELPPSDAGAAGLLTLVRELVRDPVVQRQIQEDPVLRESWENPEIRRLILQP